MKIACTALSFALLAATPFVAQAQFAKIDDAVDYRHAAMFMMSQHVGRIGAVVKGTRPYDKAAVEADAAIIETLSRLPWPAFVPGSNTPESKAKDEVWSQPEKFKAAYEKMQGETTKLALATKTGDLAQIKTAFGATTQGCKACHDNFKMK
jgi:cytochrome c556